MFEHLLGGGAEGAQEDAEEFAWKSVNRECVVDEDHDENMLRN